MPSFEYSLVEGRVLARKASARLSRWRRSVRALKSLPRNANFVVVSWSREVLARTQVYPFHLYADAIRERFGAIFCEIEAADFDRTCNGQRHPHVRWVAFQTWFDLSDEALRRRVAELRSVFPNADLVYLDFFAPLDLRYARVLAPLVTRYMKKQIFRDLDNYNRRTEGDTNLTDYYGRRYGLEQPVVRHAFPAGFDTQLCIGANFCVSPAMLDRFTAMPPDGPRAIDVHARIATKGEPWYQRMREEARSVARGLQGIKTTSEGRVSPATFLAELRNSKICFSPFGYGEVCWRDYEAIFAGSLLLKPRMDHVRLATDIFVPGETYVPLQWDYADYEDAARRHLSDEKGRRAMTSNAFDVVHRYIRSGAALEELRPLFEH
jgi:hypothetical protein